MFVSWQDFRRNFELEIMFAGWDDNVIWAKSITCCMKVEFFGFDVNEVRCRCAYHYGGIFRRKLVVGVSEVNSSLAD